MTSVRCAAWVMSTEINSRGATDLASAEQPTFVLHTRPYRESSQLVDLFSYDAGRFRAVARVSRRARKNTQMRLQPFVPYYISCRGRGDLKALTACEPMKPVPLIPGERVYIGLYLNELLYRLLPDHIPCESLYGDYSRLLDALAQDVDMEPALRGFELLLLEEMGSAIDFSADYPEGEPILVDGLYRFLPGYGLTPVVDGNRRADNVFAGVDLLAIAQGDFGLASVRRTAKLLLRQAIAAQLEGRPLRSRELYRRGFASGAKP